MGGVDIGEKTADFTSVFEGHAHEVLYCRTKKQQFLKTHANNSKKRARHHKKRSKTIKTHANNSKNGAKGSAQTPVDPSTREAQR